MNNPKHTSGPWMISPSDEFAVIYGKKTDWSVCEIRLDGCTIEHKEQEQANTRLIAAAPELLEALEAAYLELAKFNTSPDSDAKSIEVWDLVQSAIAKARGES